MLTSNFYHLGLRGQAMQTLHQKYQLRLMGGTNVRYARMDKTYSIVFAIQYCRASIVLVLLLSQKVTILNNV